MKRKTKNYLLIPDKFAQNFDDLEFIIDELIVYFNFLNEIDFEELKQMNSLHDSLDKIREEFSNICQVYGKLRQEYVVIYFQGNELFTRNTVTRIKLGLLVGKLERAKSIWDSDLSLDYEAAKELINHFTTRYLFKKDDE